MIDAYVAQADMILDRIVAHEERACEDLYDFIISPSKDYEIRDIMIQIYVKECDHGKVSSCPGTMGRIQD